eukprot:5021465-Pyramimonas_sp.AAC.1
MVRKSGRHFSGGVAGTVRSSNLVGLGKGSGSVPGAMQYRFDSSCIGSPVTVNVRKGGGVVSIKKDIAPASG